MNNARINVLNRLIAVVNIKLYDEEQGIWRGFVIEDTPEAAKIGREVFFSRKYDRENNEIDKVLEEYHFKADPDLKDVEFWLIPREKVLFAFHPHSVLHIPKPGTFQKRRPIQ